MRKKPRGGTGARPRKEREKPVPQGRPRTQDLLRKALIDSVRELHPGSSRGEEKEIPIHLQAVVIAGRRWRLEAKPSLGRQLEGAVREATAKERVFTPGHVYCYRCESSHCGHSAPPAPERVFGGYTPTGQPWWPELAQLLVELKHPGVERLYQGSGRNLAAAFVPGETLTHRQLGVFGKGSKTYDILGQAVFGYLKFPPTPKGDPRGDRAAFTLQAVEIRDRSRRPRVVLNVLGRLSDGSEAVEALVDPYHLRVLDVVVTTRRLVGRLRPASGPAGKGRSTGAEERLVSSTGTVLRKTSRSLERLGRQSERRTRHAERRHSEKRPTAKAAEDSIAAADEDLFTDDREGTVVVLGPRGRVHVFSPEGRHITSLSLKKEEVESRKRRRRWRPLDGPGRLRFRASLRSVLGV